MPFIMRHADILAPVLKLLLVISLISGSLLAGYANAQSDTTRIVIREGRIKPIRIAVMPIAAAQDAAGETQSEEALQIAEQVRLVILSNLERSGLFLSVAASLFPQSNDELKFGPDYALWWQRAIPVLIRITLNEEPNDRFRLEVRLWDTFEGEERLASAYRTSERNWRRAAHIISDDIYKALKGEEGYFDSRIVYVSEQWQGQHRFKRLALMDQDGANHSYLTNGEALVLTPRFSPTGEKISYLGYQDGAPQVYIWDIKSGQQTALGKFPGMTFSPRFSRDGDSLIMSLSRDGNIDIYIMALRTRKLQRVTSHPGIDTAPSFSPDGRYITFESDRTGRQQLYVLDLTTGRSRRISTGEGRYATPVWSPRGDLIAYTRLYKGRFYIGVMKPNGSDDRALTSAYHVEGPTWSPNGRLLMYFKEPPNSSTSGGAKLYSIDLTGYNERRVSTPFGGSDPSWSPLLR